MRLAPLLGTVTTLACAVNSRSPKPTSCSLGAQAHVASDSTVYDTTQVTEQPINRGGTRLRYPRGPLNEGVQGRVLLALILNADGTADRPSVRVLHSVHPALDAEAVRYALQAFFWPACLKGRAVRVRITMPIDFKITGPLRMD